MTLHFPTPRSPSHRLALVTLYARQVSLLQASLTELRRFAPAEGDFASPEDHATAVSAYLDRCNALAMILSETQALLGSVEG